MQGGTDWRRRGVYHCSHTPHICTRAPFRSQDDFRRSILPGLNVVCEVMSHPARVSEIRNLHRDDFNTFLRPLQFFGFHGVRFTQVHVRDIVREDVTASSVSHQSHRKHLTGTSHLDLRGLFPLLLRVSSFRQVSLGIGFDPKALEHGFLWGGWLS